MTIRLHIGERLGEGAVVAIEGPQAHYLRNVMRLKVGDSLSLFNGRDGEWVARLIEVNRRDCRAACGARLAEPRLPPDIDYLFAPLKSGRLDYLAQKATEMGVRRLRPVVTARTVSQRLNLDRLRANTIEAAEQCSLVFVPEVLEPVSLGKALAGWEEGRRLIHCDEALGGGDPLKALSGLGPGPLAVLVGPEGGFDELERAMIMRHPAALGISLGPRIMRADTAAVAVLALVQAALGDWRTDQDR